MTEVVKQKNEKKQKNFALPVEDAWYKLRKEHKDLNKRNAICA